MKIELDSGPTAPRQARRFIQEQWPSMFAGASTTEADVVLVASELVTNAVEAGARHVTIQIDVQDTQVALSVSDDARGWPTQRRPSPDDARGRGLIITTQLTTHWKATESATGKTITATWERQRG